MKRAVLVLTGLLPLLGASSLYAQADGVRRTGTPRRVWPRDRLSVRPVTAVAPSADRSAEGTGDAMRMGENLHWRRPGDDQLEPSGSPGGVGRSAGDRLAQLPDAMPYAPAPPSYSQPMGPGYSVPAPPTYTPPGGPPYAPFAAGPLAPPPLGFRSPANVAGPPRPAWQSPGYWQPNWVPPWGPECPPFYDWPYPYGCPPAPPLMPVPPPGPLPSPVAVDEPRNSNVPLLPPNMIGSLFGAQPQALTLSFEHAFFTRGTIVSGAPGSPGAVLAFERNGGFPNDFNSVPGTGRDVSGDGLTDTFAMTEPVPPNEVPTSPGPGYSYDGGTVSYTNSTSVTTAQDGQFQDNQHWYADYSFSKSLTIPAAGADSLRPMYVAQNNSPLPRDRFLFDARYFKQARPNLGDVTWATFGLEKTFHSQLGSIEARLPFARTMDNEIFEDDGLTRSSELGNVTFTVKHILWGNERWLLSGGAGVSLPTGPDTRVFRADGTEVLAIDNDAVHVQPFLAGLWLPEEHFFVQTFVATDFQTRGSDVRANINGGRLPEIGNYRDASTLIADLGAGYWIYTNPSFRALMQGLALVGEVQYQTTLESSDSVAGNGITLTGTPASIDAYSATFGLHAYLLNQLSISGGVGVPITSQDTREYDLATMLLINWHF